MRILVSCFNVHVTALCIIERNANNEKLLFPSSCVIGDLSTRDGACKAQIQWDRPWCLKSGSHSQTHTHTHTVNNTRSYTHYKWQTALYGVPCSLSTGRCSEENYSLCEADTKHSLTWEPQRTVCVCVCVCVCLPALPSMELVWFWAQITQYSYLHLPCEISFFHLLVYRHTAHTHCCLPCTSNPDHHDTPTSTALRQY